MLRSLTQFEAGIHPIHSIPFARDITTHNLRIMPTKQPKEQVKTTTTDDSSNTTNESKSDGSRRRVHPLRSRGRRKKSKNKDNGANNSISKEQHHDSSKRDKNGNHHRHTNTHTCSSASNHAKENYVALDCEFVGVGPGGFENALARVSLVDWRGNVLLDTFVKVSQKITDYRTFVSGVRAENLEDAMPFERARRKVQTLLKDKVLVGHGLVCDLECLKISHPLHRIRDTATYAPFMQWKVVSGDYSTDQKALVFPRKLRDLVREMFGVSIQEYAATDGNNDRKHCSVEDAYWALQLFKAARKEWEGDMKCTKKSSSSSRSSSSRHHRKCLPSAGDEQASRAAAICVLRH